MKFWPLLLTPLVSLPLLAADAPTFHKDVLPILQNRCQECHRPGQIGPMPLQTYQQARPWAAAIKEQVLTRKMPPWDADPHVGKFANDRSMPSQEIDTLVAWASTGATEGKPADAPAVRKFSDEWNIQKPDVIIGMPRAFEVQAKGEVDYQYIVVPTGFKEDKWVTQSEIRSTAPGVVHHVIVFVREPGNPWLRDEAQVGVPFTKDNQAGGMNSDMLMGWAPGAGVQKLAADSAKLVPAGSDLVFEMHYTPNGKPAADQSSIGLVFAKTPPKDRVLSLFAANPRFNIPPGDPNYETPIAFTFERPAILQAMVPHMHLRGKLMDVAIQYPDGRTEPILSVPRYRFHWQLQYNLEKPIEIPVGAKLVAKARFDNSKGNAFNPDPTASVHWGEQTFQEMALIYFDVRVDAKTARRDFMPQQPQQQRPSPK